MEISTTPRKEKPKQLNPDAWVNNQTGKEALKRFTIDIPEGLHTRIKTTCASKGVKMRDEIIALLEKHFAGNV